MGFPRGKYYRLVIAELKWFEKANVIGNDETGPGYLEYIKGLRKDRLWHLENYLPKRFDENYSKRDYEKDQQNIAHHWTAWAHEDLYETRASLARIRKYEKRLAEQKEVIQ